VIKHLYFVRHGQSEANAAHVRAGQMNVPLTAQGREQARQAGVELRKADISYIVSSDLDRAKETAEIIAYEIGYEPSDIVSDERLREIHVGGLTGAADDGFGQYLAYLTTHAGEPQLETPADVATRLKEVLSELTDRDGTVLLVSHAGTGRVLKAMLGGIDIETLANETVPNADPIEMPVIRIKEIVK
jgi:broad specificity phosphatase PhoE